MSYGVEMFHLMFDQQSQAPSTHFALFKAKLKKVLRLNRDR